MYEALRQEILKLIINHEDPYTCDLAVDALRAVCRWEGNVKKEPTNLAAAPPTAR